MSRRRDLITLALLIVVMAVLCAFQWWIIYRAFMRLPFWPHA